MFDASCDGKSPYYMCRTGIAFKAATGYGNAQDCVYEKFKGACV